MDFERILLNFKNIDDRVSYAATLPEKLVFDLCGKNTELNNTICLNEEYWKIRYLKNHKQPTTLPNSWKELYLYKNINKAWSFGLNIFGQLGLGDLVNRTKPTQIPNIEAVKVACGDKHSLLIDMNNNVWSFGLNNTGQTGLRHGTSFIHIPTQIPTPSGIKAKQIACGGYHSVIIDMNNNVWSFGVNDYGQLGLGDTEDINIPTPTQIMRPSGIKAKHVSCGAYHSILIDMNNNVWSFGLNDFGGLGLGLENGTSKNKPTQIFGIKAVHSACGAYHSILIDTNNNAWSFGANDMGQLGLGDFGMGTERNIPTQIQMPSGIKAKQSACGDVFSIIIDTNDHAWSFGSNRYGQLGVKNSGIGIHRSIPIKIPNINVEQISCGGNHSIIMDMNGDVWSFGNNYYGQLGLGDHGNGTNRNKPTQIPDVKATQISCGEYHSILINYLFITFDEIIILFSNKQITKFEFEPQMQVYYKALQGIYVATFTLDDETKKYGYVKYNSQTNQISTP